MIESLMEAPGWFIGVLWLLLVLLVALGFFARRDGYVSGRRAEAERNRRQRKYDYERGVVEGVRGTLAHLRESGELSEFSRLPATLHTNDD